MPASGRRRCWASDLGDCDGGLSREHVLSVNFFQLGDPSASRAEKEKHVITYSGWTAAGGDFERTHPLGTLTSRILCKKHNEESSPLDVAAGDFAAGFRDWRDKHVARQFSRLPWMVRRHRVDGPLFERWLLKTAINMARTYSEGLPVGGRDAEVDHPTVTLVEMVFGRRPVHAPFGLWFVKPPGDRAILDTSIRVKFWHVEGYVGGAVVDVGGVTFVIGLCHHEPDWDRVRFWKRWPALERYRQLAILGDPQSAVEIELVWP